MSENNPRCPNCGGFKTEEQSIGSSIGIGFLFFLYVVFGLATYGIICLVGLPFLPWFYREFQKAGNQEGYVCKIWAIVGVHNFTLYRRQA
jgi:hypothetical protein